MGLQGYLGIFMKKEIATKNKQLHVKCTHCSDEIFWNTHKRLTRCKCGKIYVDGCEDYIRIGGNKKDYKMVQKIPLLNHEKSL